MEFAFCHCSMVMWWLRLVVYYARKPLQDGFSLQLCLEKAKHRAPKPPIWSHKGDVQPHSVSEILGAISEILWLIGVIGVLSKSYPPGN